MRRGQFKTFNKQFPERRLDVSINQIAETPELSDVSQRVRTRRIRALSSVAMLTLALAASGHSAAQALLPPVEGQTNDTACLGLANLKTEENIQFETFLTSAVRLSPIARTATLRLHKGYYGPGFNSPVYYIVTESSDCRDAKERGVNFSPKLGLLIDGDGKPVNKSVQQVTVDSHGALHFPGTVTFGNVRKFTAGPAANPFLPPAPPFQPGSIGDANYSPVITFVNEEGKHVVLNASQVANWTGIKDFVPEIDFEHMTATFNLVLGIYDFHFVMYLRMDASDPFISAFEGGVYAPNLELAPIGGDRFFADGSARQTILPTYNGIRGVDRIFQRQGVESAALGQGDPLNVLGSRPGDTPEYSPLWDITMVEWTPTAIASGLRQRLRMDDEIKSFLSFNGPKGPLLIGFPGATGPVNADFNIHSLGIVSNCPVMLRVLDGLSPYDPKNPNPTPIPQ